MEKLLIPDLDETLIHASKEKLLIEEDFKYEDYFIYIRPQLDYFLNEISKSYKIGIWSSASDDYVTDIVSLLKPQNIEFEIVWGRSKCSLKRNFTFDEYFFEKRLDKLKKKGYKLEQILIVDDTPEKSRTNYGNAIHIKEYTGDLNDTELYHLVKFLDEIKNVENVRNIEKRNWIKTYS